METPIYAICMSLPRFFRIKAPPTQALLNAVVFGVEGISERALKSLWSEERPMLTGPLDPLGLRWGFTG